MQNKIHGSNILVTGGAGFIGSYLVEELLSHQPRKVIILDSLIRGSMDNMQSFLSNSVVEFIQGDIRDIALLEHCVSRVDYVFHMAALRINACAADPSEGFEVMLRSTLEVADLCVRYKINKVIYSSSASVYGLAQHFPTPESDNPYDNQTFYGAAKLWGEQLFRSYKFMYGLDYLALRYFNVYGPRMDTDGKYTEVMIRWLDCIRDGHAPLIYGNGGTSMDFVYVKDVAKANVNALLSDKTDESYNVGNGVETTLKELLKILLEVNKSDLQPQFREENVINPVSRRLADISKINRDLKYEPQVSLQEGLHNLSVWYYKKKESLSPNI